MSFAEYEMKVIQWSEKRKIIPNSTPLAQSIKACEEINELVDALRDGNKIEAIDAVGDTVVCLINVCALLDVNLTDCLEAAESIKDVAKMHNEVIVAGLQRFGPMGKDQIANNTGLQPNQVSRRLSELEQIGLIELTGKQVKSNSGRNEREWRFKPVQQELA